MRVTSLPTISALFLIIPVMHTEAAEPSPHPGFQPAPARVAEIAALLPPQPRGVGPVPTETQAWQALAGDPWFQMKLEQAQEALTTEPPLLTPDLYLDFSRNGDRTSFEKPMGARARRLSALAVAACIQPSETILSELEKEILYHCARPTWVMPAHDRELKNFEGTEISIDLGSALLAAQLAEIHVLLGTKLSDNVRGQIRGKVQTFILAPFAAMLRGERKPDAWLTVTNNWNAVCLNGVLGCALALIEDRDERAYFVAAAEKLSLHFLEGFGKDAYCSEGLAYWNYGFGHYVQLSQTVRLATGGKLDFLARPQAKLAAAYPSRIHILNGVYPAFSDAPVDVTASDTLLRVLQNLLPEVATPPHDVSGIPAYASLPEALLFSPLRDSNADSPPTPVRPVTDWFPEAGVLVVRQRGAEKPDFAAAMKGGRNDEHHNHNDLGSFVVVSGSKALLIDPGKEVYTARTFSDRRYDSDVMNSFGHSVPIVAGKLQETGSASVAEVLERESTPDAEKLKLDLSSAYAVGGIEQLDRAFIFQRGASPTFSVEDKVKFASPQSFGTALIVPPDAEVQTQTDGSFSVTSGTDAVRVRVIAEGGELSMTTTDLKDGIKPKRLGFDFKDPIMSGSITITVQPETNAR